MDATQSWIGNVEILEALDALDVSFARESWYNTWWAKFAGFTDISRDDNGNMLVQPSGMPVEMFRRPVEEGRDNILLPFLKRLVGEPKYGDQTLKGSGEKQVLNWMRGYVNQTRKAVEAQGGQMSYQRQKIHRLREKARPQLADWFSQNENMEVTRAMYEGASLNLTRSTATKGLGLYKRYHPNWYVNDGGTLTAVGTEKSTKTAANLDTAVTNADTDFGLDFLRQAAIKAQELRIPQMETSAGVPMWVLILHPQSARSLKAESDFHSAVNAAYTQALANHPTFTGLIAWCEGFAIYEDIYIPRAWDSTNDTLFGSTWEDAMDVSDVTTHANVNNIVLGKGALGKAIGEDLHFTEEVDDHGQVIEVGGAQINGYNRADFTTEANAGESSGLFQNGGAGGVASATAVINQSSMILMTDETA